MEEEEVEVEFRVSLLLLLLMFFLIFFQMHKKNIVIVFYLCYYLPPFCSSYLHHLPLHVLPLIVVSFVLVFFFISSSLNVLVLLLLVIFIIIFSCYRWVCEDIPELKRAMEVNILSDYDTRRYVFRRSVFPCVRYVVPSYVYVRHNNWLIHTCIHSFIPP